MSNKLKIRTGIAWLLGVAAITLGATPASADITQQSADVIGQGLLGPVVASNGAKLIRSDTGLTATIRIPRPQTGTYAYPSGNPWNPDAVPGLTEVFSFWVFVFNYPDECSVPYECGLGDFMAGRGAPAAFNAGGHVVGDAPYLQLSGHVSLNSEPFLPPGGRLIEPMTAEVHFAIAPHGALNPEYMPNQIQAPIGTIDQWWLALF